MVLDVASMRWLMRMEVVAWWRYRVEICASCLDCEPVKEGARVTIGIGQSICLKRLRQPRSECLVSSTARGLPRICCRSSQSPCGSALVPRGIFCRLEGGSVSPKSLSDQDPGVNHLTLLVRHHQLCRQPASISAQRTILGQIGSLTAGKQVGWIALS